METRCIYSSDDLADIEAVKGLLEEGGYPVMVKNQFTQNIFGGLKPFSGHDPIAGSMEIHVREDHVDPCLELLESTMGDDEVEVAREEEEGADEAVVETRESSEAAFMRIAKEKRLLYFGYLCAALSWFLLPYVGCLAIGVILSKKRRMASRMLLSLGTILFLVGLYFVFTGEGS